MLPLGARWIGRALFRMSWLSDPSLVLMTTTYLLGRRDRLTRSRRGEHDLGVGHEALDECGSNEFAPPPGAVESHVVEDDHAEVGIELDLPLELALHRPVDRLIEDVGFADRSSDELGDRPLASVALGRRDLVQRLLTEPMVPQEGREGGCDGVGSVRIGSQTPSRPGKP